MGICDAMRRWIAATLAGWLIVAVSAPGAIGEPAGTRALIAELHASTGISVETARLSWQLDRASGWFDDLGSDVATADEIAGNARTMRARLEPRLRALRKQVRDHLPGAVNQPPLYADPPSWTRYLRSTLTDIERQIAALDALIGAVGRMDIEEVLEIRLRAREALLDQFERGLGAMLALQQVYPADHPDHLLIQSEVDLWRATRAAYEMQVSAEADYDDLLRTYPADLRRGIGRSEAALQAAELALPAYRHDLTQRLGDIWPDDRLPGEAVARSARALSVYRAVIANRRKLHQVLEEEAALYEIFAEAGWTPAVEYAFGVFYDRLEEVSIEGVTLGNRLYGVLDPEAEGGTQ